jgi:hypothetical protein
MISFDSPNAPLQLRGYRVDWKRLLAYDCYSSAK